MLSRMGLVMLAGKGILGTRTGRTLVGRLGRSLARTALARLDGIADAASRADASVSDGQANRQKGRQSGRDGRMNGHPAGCAGHAGHSGEELRDGLRATVCAVLSRTETAPTPSPCTPPVAAPSTLPVEDMGRVAALAALEAHIVSFTNGRVRLRHPALRQPEAHAVLREALGNQRCFTELTFSARTGSVLLEYDGRTLSRADFGEAALPLGHYLAQWERLMQNV